jgi:hypothetical protein
MEISNLFKEIDKIMEEINKMAITSTNSKPKFNLNDEKVKSIFTAKNFEVPTSKEEFLNTMKEKRMPVKFISDAIMKVKHWEQDDLEDNCPGRQSKVELFLKLYDVVYATPKASAFTVETPSESATQTPSQSAVDFDADVQLSLKDAQEFLQQHSNELEKDTENRIKVKSPTFCENMPITLNTDFKMQYVNSNVPVSHNNVFIVDTTCKNVATVGKIIKQEDSKTLYFVADKENINYSMYNGQSAFNIALLAIDENGNPTGKMLYKEIKMTMQQLETSDKVLCIDFGTSNTTVGTYHVKDKLGNNPELVQFADVVHNNKMVECCPTMVYVTDCSDPQNIVYQFGYNAKKMERQGNYESRASIFYQLKHWLQEDSSFKTEETITDENGKCTDVPTKDIVKAYLKYIISQAQEYFNVKFKKLHFTAPVKMKGKFISTLKEMLPEYEIMSEKDSIDEAGAIIFDYVSKKFEDTQSTANGSVVVIDCGGGTTDLAICDYNFGEKSSIGQRELNMYTRFSNGNANFGGNNITCKLMQLIKIKLALKSGFISEDDYEKIFSCSENKILETIDNGENLYTYFEELYKKCEGFLPTQFADDGRWWDDGDIAKVKRNFYYLWQYAEQVKIVFYREEKIVLYDEAQNNFLEVDSNDSYNYLYYIDTTNEDNVLKKEENPFGSLKITITEIRKIIYGDIYSLLSEILPQSPDEPEHYRLSGQSCKINLFTDLLKEFIPGKKLREKLNEYSENQESLALKLRCINGSIKYMMYKYTNIGAKVTAESMVSDQIYNICIENMGGSEIPTLDRNILKYIPVKNELAELKIVVKNKQGEEMRKFSIPANVTQKEFSLYDGDLDKMFRKLKSNCLDSIDWEESKRKLADFKEDVFFAVAIPAGKQDGYGFYVYFIRKKIDSSGQKYAMTTGAYYNYENTEISFFDGKR